MDKTEEMNQIFKIAKERFAQFEELIALLDILLKDKSGKTYSLLEIVAKQEISPLQALLKNEHYYDLTNLYPNMLWSSIFLSTYSIFEHALLEICNSFHKNNEGYASLQDLNHKGINKAKIYIKKIMKVNFPDKTKEWAFISNSNTIRNCLIHRSGDLSSYDSNCKLMKFIDSTTIVYKIENKIIIEIDFPIEFIKSCSNILDNLTKQLIERNL